MPYANYCQDQAAACARRAKLASSPEIVAYCRTLERHWLKLAVQAQDTGGALGHESDPAATSFPLPEKPAAYPVEYGKRAGELIARGARSLSPRKVPRGHTQTELAFLSSCDEEATDKIG